VSVYFKNVNVAPLGGFFYELNGERVTGRHFCEMEGPVRALLRKYHRTETVEEAVANYMCPRIPEASWLCTGGFKESKIRPAEALANSINLTSGRDVVTFDEIERRLRVCMACPMHTREFCVTCTGHIERIILMFDGRRRKVPEDAGSGICKCAKAYEAALASVAYGKDEALWEGVPNICWRKTT
jgi:hypothetical protein